MLPASVAATRCQYKGVWCHFLSDPMFLPWKALVHGMKVLVPEGYTALPPPPWTDKHPWKHYLPATSFGGGNSTVMQTLLTFCMTGNLYMNTVETEHGKIENNSQMFPLPHFQLKSVNICTSLTSKLKTYMETCFLVFTAGKRSCGKVMFLHLSVSHSVHMGSGGGSLYDVISEFLSGCLVPCSFRGVSGPMFLLEGSLPGGQGLPWIEKPPLYGKE